MVSIPLLRVASRTYRVVLAGSSFLHRQNVSMDIRNHRLGVFDHRLCIRNYSLGVRNHHVSTDCQLGLKGRC